MITKAMITASSLLSSGQTIATFQRNIAGRNTLRAFNHLVATCCDMLCVVDSSLKIKLNQIIVLCMHASECKLKIKTTDSHNANSKEILTTQTVSSTYRGKHSTRLKLSSIYIFYSIYIATKFWSCFFYKFLWIC